MLSYLFMKVLENRPRSYDRRMNKISLGHIKSVKENVVREIPENAQVLEIGCGTGELTTMLLTRGATITAFDANPAMVAVARERVKNKGLKNKLTIREMGIEGMDNLSSASYDAVVSTLVFSELSEGERHFALMHSKRVLKPGGVLVIADEVIPHKAVRKFLQFLVRLPILVLTYLVSRASTHPLSNLPGDLNNAGFKMKKEIRSKGGTFAMVVGGVPEVNKI
jgi:demethylmenaquinone methyltransferase/2-methoxy-6-polyprenyl-1,4-benzoquinol methylase